MFGHGLPSSSRRLQNPYKPPDPSKASQRKDWYTLMQESINETGRHSSAPSESKMNSEESKNMDDDQPKEEQWQYLDFQIIVQIL